MTNPRNIKYIVLHCTATQPFASVEAIQRYWKEQLKWKSPGYHYIISANGGVKQLADESDVTNGVQGFNQASVHVSYIGGIDEKGDPKDTRTPEQLEAMKALVKKLKAKYPTAKILGHRDFPRVKKACPSFDVADWISKLI
ncbi:N-acetylmuramoyl-L-alanine amidase [Chitinophaga rhizosphaerae]|uniref:N-acetylmuramoyl-L-alanine amidase n=1 Tax=Chitinophaga rhizosphaerae TaxID=1864947 RepID=UPI000F8003EF|nr:N-acetylmuramoyl-L-alanine amidase [Chitinophaga rhizosphaerae]